MPMLFTGNDPAAGPGMPLAASRGSQETEWERWLAT
jgi:hypothetical protein